MAEKRKLEDDDNTCLGYIHNVTPIKKSKANNSYFEGTVQTSDATFRRLVCFDASKHGILKGAETASTPVKLTDVRRTPSKLRPTDEDILINARSKIDVTKKVLFRPNKPSQEKDTATSTGSTTDIAVITESVPERTGKISVSGTIIALNPPTKRDVRGKIMQMQEASIADKTGYISITLWETLVDSLKKDNSYTITNLSTRSYQNIKSLTTTPETTIQSIESIDIEGMEIVQLPTSKKITGSILQVQVLMLRACSACNKKINQCPSTKFYRCQHCSMLQKTEAMSRTLNGILNVKDGNTGETLKLTLTNSSIADYVKQEKKFQGTTTQVEVEVLEEHFLELDSVCLSYSPKDLVITHIEKQE